MKVKYLGAIFFGGAMGRVASRGGVRSSPVSSFWAGRRVDRGVFVGICAARSSPGLPGVRSWVRLLVGREPMT